MSASLEPVPCNLGWCLIDIHIEERVQQGSNLASLSSLVNRHGGEAVFRQAAEVAKPNM